MTPAVWALPNGLFRLQCHLKSLLFPSQILSLKAFSSSLASDNEGTPAMEASSSPDSSIFEPWSDEYVHTRLPDAVAQRSTGRAAFPQSANKGYRASELLEKLSRSKKFEEAEEVRQELVHMNVPIRPSSAYYSVVWDILHRRPWPPNRAQLLAKWLSLLPRISDKKINFFNFKSSLFFNSTNLDLETVAQFGVILSSKGYIRDIGASVVACLTRYASPEISSQILDEMIAANEDYSRRESGSTSNALAGKNRSTTKRLWSIAVRTHCTAGRSEFAFQMTKRAHEHGFQLTKFTYEYLLGKLGADGLNDLAAEVRAISGYESLGVAKSRLIEDAFGDTIIPPISRKQHIAINEAIALATLKRGSRSGLPVHAIDIEPFFDLYKFDLRGGRAVNQLRSRAYKISLPAASAVLLAEQLHHHRRGQFRHVLWVFEKFFHAVGVPLEDVKRRLWKREHYPRHLQLHPWYLPSRIKETTFNLPSKLWPTRYHTALVWTALVQLCETEEELFDLYELLLQRSAHFQKKSTVGDHTPSDDSSDSSSVSEPVLAPTDKFDAAHYRPFLIAITLLRDANAGLRVLDDMQERGVAPSAQFLSTAAALQAKHGEPALALRMLDVTRGLFEHGGDEVETDGLLEMEPGMGADEKTRKKRWVLAAYTGVLRGLVDRRNIVKARQVAGQLRSQLGYVEGAGIAGGVDGGGGCGKNMRTDAALRYLRRLEEVGLDAEPEPLADVDDSYHYHYYYHFLKKRDSEVCPFFLCMHIKLGFGPALPFFPHGERRSAMRFYVGTYGWLFAQLIKILNAPPRTNPL